MTAARPDGVSLCHQDQAAARPDHPLSSARRLKLEPADYLGRVYEEQAVANQYQGQFFTPEPVVELMDAITMPEISDTAIVADPACGSGRMLVAGIRRNRLATFVGTDTDLTCVHMTALNCLVRNANTWIIHGNSMSLEAWGGYHVRRTFMGGELHQLTRDQAQSVVRAPFAKPDTATALSAPEPSPYPPHPAPTVQEAPPEAKAALDDIAKQFKTDKRGQGDFGF